jgi:hypothetical protein
LHFSMRISGNLVEDAAGDLFGTTTGSVFEVKKTGSNYGAPTSLLSIPMGTQIGTLTIDGKGNVFGTTITGGANDDGTAFEIEKTATGRGRLARANVVADANGNLFGATQAGGVNNKASAFEITNSGFATTPTVAPIISEIPWQNSDGQASIWEMNTRIGGGPAGSNPGPTWKAVGTGDFNGDGKSDIVLQNTDGQVSFWEMNRTNISPTLPWLILVRVGTPSDPAGGIEKPTGRPLPKQVQRRP